MITSLRKSVVIGFSAIGLSVLASSAQAIPLPVQNLTFSTYSGVAPKNNFSAVNPANWYRGVPAAISDLVFIDAPGTATSSTGGYPVYGPFANPPSGGNFVQADGNPDFASTFKQDISGLTPNTLYELSFWQAAGQQQGFIGDTTEQWKVFLGDGNVTLDGPSGGFYNVSASTLLTNLESDSPIMNTPSGGVHGWEQVSVSFLTSATAAATQTLTFLAWGNNGSNVNQPPTVFLAGVNSPAVPEPASLALFGIGLLGFGMSRLRRPANHTEEI